MVDEYNEAVEKYNISKKDFVHDNYWGEYDAEFFEAIFGNNDIDMVSDVSELDEEDMEKVYDELNMYYKVYHVNNVSYEQTTN